MKYKYKIGDKVRLKDFPDCHYKITGFNPIYANSRIAYTLSSKHDETWELEENLELIPVKSSNPFKVGDKLYYNDKSCDPDAYAGIVARLGDLWGNNLDTTVTYEDGGWDSVTSLYRKEESTPNTITYEIICNGITKAYDDYEEYSNAYAILLKFKLQFEVYKTEKTRTKIVG